MSVTEVGELPFHRLQTNFVGLGTLSPAISNIPKNQNAIAITLSPDDYQIALRAEEIASTLGPTLIVHTHQATRILLFNLVQSRWLSSKTELG